MLNFEFKILQKLFSVRKIAKISRENPKTEKKTLVLLRVI